MSTKTKIVNIFIAIAVLCAAVSFAIFCTWSKLIYLAAFAIALLLFVNERAKKEQLKYSNIRLVEEIEKVNRNMGMTVSHNNILMSIIEKMEEDKNLADATSEVVNEQVNELKKEVDVATQNGTGANE